VRWRSSQCPSLGCSALGAEQERIDGMKNGMIYLGSPPCGSTLSHIYQDRLGIWRFGGRVYGLHALESRRVLQRCSVDRGDVVEPKKP
jgi:hypothetical protein